MDINDVKGPIDPPLDWTWIIIVAIILCIVLIAVLLIYFKNKKKLVSVQKTPTEYALEALEALRQSELLKQKQWKEFFDQLSDVVRNFFECQFNIKAPEMTSEEFLNYLQDTQSLNAEQKQALKEFLGICDMAKFAKYVPDVEIAIKNIELAKTLILSARN